MSKQTHEDLMFDVHYGHWYNLKCERVYRHLDLGLNFVQLVGGSGAALAALNQSAKLLVTVGVLLAMCAALSLLVQPSVKAFQHELAKRGYMRLMADGERMETPVLATALAAVRADAPTGLTQLAMPAFHQTMLATGRVDELKSTGVGLLARLVNALS